jgi:hypothetical protein
VEEAKVTWDMRLKKPYDRYPSLREYFINDGLLGWNYLPKSRMPGERWRWNPAWISHEISTVFQHIIRTGSGFLGIEERLIRWGLVMHISSKIQEFRNGYLKHSEQWDRVLLVLDIREEDIRVMEEFVSKMPSLNPIRDLIPIRVLEVITVFRVMFRLSLRKFELAYDD